jgi:DNA-binding response OmpR family regulator
VATVLLIEDQTALRLVIGINLALAGIDLLEAENGVAGLELARTAKPDVIVLDIRLPDLDGWQVADELRNDPATSNIPLIFLTAHADTATRERGLQLGAVDFITKPFDMNVLVGRIAKVLLRPAE